MQILRNRFTRVTLLAASIALAFAIGESLGARYALIREMQHHEGTLLRNLSVLAICKHEPCNEAFQRMLIQGNDDAMSQHVALEEANKNILSRIFWYTTWPVNYALFSSQNANTSARLRELYRKLNCGLNGMVCVPGYGSG